MRPVYTTRGNFFYVKRTNRRLRCTERMTTLKLWCKIKTHLAKGVYISISIYQHLHNSPPSDIGSDVQGCVVVLMTV